MVPSRSGSLPWAAHASAAPTAPWPRSSGSSSSWEALVQYCTNLQGIQLHPKAAGNEEAEVARPYRVLQM